MSNKVLLFVLVAFIASCSSTKTKSYEDEYSEYIISNVTECLVDTLFSHNDTGIISSVEIQIIGYVNGSAIIKFENGAGRFEEVYLADSVRYVYRNNSKPLFDNPQKIIEKYENMYNQRHSEGTAE